MICSGMERSPRCVNSCFQLIGICVTIAKSHASTVNTKVHCKINVTRAYVLVTGTRAELYPRLLCSKVPVILVEHTVPSTRLE